MHNAASLRTQIESTLAHRMASPFRAPERAGPDLVDCGIAAVDALMHGGLPVGVLTELVGSECSGRTSIALAYMAAIMRGGKVCAWIDVADTLEPESAAACAVDLERLLWIRCGQDLQPSLMKADSSSDARPVPAVVALPGLPVRGGGSPHPRSEARDMPQAIGSMLHAHGGLYDRQVRREKKTLGTPGVPNRPLVFRSNDREEQIPTDRMPARRGEPTLSPRCAEPAPKQAATVPVSRPRLTMQPKLFGSEMRQTGKPWQALDQALRATDLLLQGGGFSAIVLDLGSAPAEMVWRIPLATWFRFRAACERTRVSLLLLTQHPCARSAAELVIHMEAGQMEAEGKVMTGIRYSAATERQRSQREKLVSIRKPPQPERGQWRGRAAWAQGE